MASVAPGTAGHAACEGHSTTVSFIRSCAVSVLPIMRSAAAIVCGWRSEVHWLMLTPPPRRKRVTSTAFRTLGMNTQRLLLAATATTATGAPGSVSSADCWVGGWTPEICCSAPGAKGNPLCWDHVYTFDKCCTETEEGIQFDLRRRNFVSDMVRRGATVHFDIRHVSGGRTGAVASRTLSARSTVLRVPAAQVYSLKSVPPQLAEAARRHSCDAHAVLALGLALERANPSSMLTAWIKLLPMSFANVLWFTETQLQLVNSTFFAYIVQNWFGDLECMHRAADEIPPGIWRGRRVDYEDLRWALSVVKTRGFAFEGTRESTMLIPLADFLNHNRIANVRTATLAEDALRFVATKTVMPGEELCIDYAQASNLEFLVRYGFRVEDNPYGGRQFDLGGEPLQAHCPSYILRYDTPDIIENATVDCHRQARYLSFEQQFGTLQPHEQLREDRYIYHAVEEACLRLLSMLEPPRPLSEYETEGSATANTAGWSMTGGRGSSEGITAVLVREIRAERALLQRCAMEFQQRQRELEPRPVPTTLAEPLARLRGAPAGAEDIVGFEAGGMETGSETFTNFGNFGGATAFSSSSSGSFGPPSSASAVASAAGYSMGLGVSSTPPSGFGPPTVAYGPDAHGVGAYGDAGSYGASSYGANAYDGTSAYGAYGMAGGPYAGVPGVVGGPYRSMPGAVSNGYRVPSGIAAASGDFASGAASARPAGGGANVGSDITEAASPASSSSSSGSFATPLDRSRVDQLLQRLQQGASIA